MFWSDLTLARRLERAEALACRDFAQARRRVHPEIAADWMECAGALAIFDGVDSPSTQTFGLGIFEPLNESTLEAVERFFSQRGAPANHELSPLAGIGAVELLCRRGYTPVELSSVLYRSVEAQPAPSTSNIRVHVTSPRESALWADTSARAWSHEHPELLDFIRESGKVSAECENSVRLLAEIDGVPAATASLLLHEGVALFAGSATVPEHRRRGLQGALLEERMRHARDHGCDLAMMVAAVGSTSQRNAERKGFRIAYTRTKWQRK